MIVLKVHVDGITIDESESDPPVSGHRHRVRAFPVSLQCMKVIARNVHVLWPDRGIQSIQDTADSVGLFRIDAAAFIPREVAIKSLVADILDHNAFAMSRIASIVMLRIALSTTRSRMSARGLYSAPRS